MALPPSSSVSSGAPRFGPVHAQGLCFARPGSPARGDRFPGRPGQGPGHRLFPPFFRGRGCREALIGRRSRGFPAARLCVLRPQRRAAPVVRSRMALHLRMQRGGPMRPDCPARARGWGVPAPDGSPASPGSLAGSRAPTGRPWPGRRRARKRLLASGSAGSLAAFAHLHAWDWLALSRRAGRRERRAPGAFRLARAPASLAPQAPSQAKVLPWGDPQQPLGAGRPYPGRRERPLPWAQGLKNPNRGPGSFCR